MFKNFLICVICSLICVSCVYAQQQQTETLTITTYYPSPYGSYRELRAYQIAVGSEYTDPALYPLADGRLIVSGNVGIGEPAPGWPLTIKGSDPRIVLNDTGAIFPPVVYLGHVDGSIFIGSSAGTTGRKFSISTNAPDDTMLIDSSGNVGIGTSQPQTSLDIRGVKSIIANVGGIYVESVGAGASPAIVFGSLAQSGGMQFGYLGVSRDSGHGGEGTMISDVVLGNELQSSRVVFANRDYNTNRLRVRAKINSFGNLEVGETNANTKAKLSVEGDMAIGSGYLGAIPPTNGMVVEGNVGIGTNNPGNYKLYVNGDLFVNGTINGYTVAQLASLPAHNHGGSTGTAAGHSHGIALEGSDLAEYMPVKEKLEAGEVVVFSFEGEGGNFFVAPCDKEYDKLLVGVVSTEQALTLGEAGEGKSPIGLLGKLLIKVSAVNGAIKKGDFLTTSGTKGYAMKATQAGIIVGRALEDFSGSAEGETTGKILAFVNVGWFGGTE